MRVNLNNYGSGAFIRIIREWAGLTQKEFGKLIGKSERTIQAYEAGTTKYNIKILEDVVKKLNINIVAEKKK